MAHYPTSTDPIAIPVACGCLCAGGAVEVDNCCPVPVGQGVSTTLYVEVVSSGCFTPATVYTLTYAGYIEFLTGAFAHFWLAAPDGTGETGTYGQWCVAMRCIEVLSTYYIQARVNYIRTGLYSDMWTGVGSAFNLNLNEGLRTDECDGGTLPAPGSYAPTAPPVSLVPTSGNPCDGTGTTTVDVYD